MNQPEITAGPLLLRPWRHTDAGALVAAWADPEIRRWARYGAVLPSVESMEPWVSWNEEQWRIGGRAAFAIQDADAGLAGSITLRDFGKDAKGDGGDTAEVGYWIVPRARGRGVAPAALTAVSRWAFEREEDGGLGVRRVELLHSVENLGSCRVAQKAGYLHEGTLRESFRYADGAWHDEHMHARLWSDPVS
ncbi:GNAT family N-acetyltransferase [Actinospica durhamensis]|uniref:GNAT family N-acetyltransferase n=1 Tax=Actinospica durhamensis TaxID=1508375 RepID=A0A941IRY9_9ACTN|nr:GNAT family protein [Actinospica durhamensis]MBR7835827.1 GNAT family N-acetyltransferase [Actinospica durhamensis]